MQAASLKVLGSRKVAHDVVCVKSANNLFQHQEIGPGRSMGDETFTMQVTGTAVQISHHAISIQNIFTRLQEISNGRHWLVYLIIS
jgi:predicted RNA-binding protein